ncbi:MAG TPA: gephyrin-like molybdotransferase Glp [Anaerolineales bacterium]|nr:gephyrin-like molybdotransferase Glp [Anaerolineales bacterium]
MNLLSVEQARERILGHFQPVTTETVPLGEGSERVLAQSITASNDLPPFDNSSMDGFAVRAADVAEASSDSPRRLRVVADIPAGTQASIVLGQGEAARIMTGAPLPDGADAIVPVEDTDVNHRDAGASAPAEVQIFKSVDIGANRRPRGIDVRAGEIVLHPGRLLKPQDLGLLAMLGVSQVPVFRKPRLALFSSGDELLEVEAPLEDGKIRDSNSYMLAALIEGAGADVLQLGVAMDNPESVQALLKKAVEAHVDLILSSAGVSVGAFDFVKQVIESNGKMDFWRVNMRPGKPLAFGEYNGIPFIGLPGNPVSAYVGFKVFVHPSIQRLRGLPGEGRQTIRVHCDQQIDSDGRESYLRAQVQPDPETGVWIARLAGHQGSGNLHALVHANALLIIPAGVKCVPAGQDLEAWFI